MAGGDREMDNNINGFLLFALACAEAAKNFNFGELEMSVKVENTLYNLLTFTPNNLIFTPTFLVDSNDKKVFDNYVAEILRAGAPLVFLWLNLKDIYLERASFDDFAKMHGGYVSMDGIKPTSSPFSHQEEKLQIFKNKGKDFIGYKVFTYKGIFMGAVEWNDEDLNFYEKPYDRVDYFNENGNLFHTKILKDGMWTIC